MLERLKEMTGIYRLGFERESFFGLILPILFVVIVGGILGAIIAMR